MRLFEPLKELRDRLRAYPPWVLALAAPLYPLLLFGWLLAIPLRLPAWLLGPVLRPLLAPITRSRVVRWLQAKRVEDFAVDLADLAGLLRWDTTQAGDLLGRIRVSRRILLSLIASQWSILLVFGLVAGMSVLGSVLPWAPFLVRSCLLAFLLAMILSVLGVGYYERLYARWQELDMTLCGQCGYIREHLQGPRCPECGTSEPPVQPGHAPRCRDLWAPLLSRRMAFAPFVLLNLGFLFDRVVLNPFVGAKLHGWLILLMTASLGSLLLRVLWLSRFRWRGAYHRLGDGGAQSG